MTDLNHVDGAPVGPVRSKPKKRWGVRLFWGKAERAWDRWYATERARDEALNAFESGRGILHTLMTGAEKINR